MIADGGNVYGDRVIPGSLKLIGVQGSGATRDKVNGTAEIVKPSYSTSGHLNVGLYRQSLETVNLTGEDASNYSISYTTERANYKVSPKVINLEGSRPYDGTVNFDASFFGDNGIIAGVGSETLILIGTATVTSPNIDSGRQPLILGTLRLSDGANGGKATNYTLEGGSHFGTIKGNKP